MNERIAKALVSFWEHATDTSKQFFVCSGAFVQPGVVLTVKHAFNPGAPTLYVRPNTGGLEAYPVRETVFHPELDAALVKLEVPPKGAECLGFDLGTEDDLGSGQTRMYGYFEGRLEPDLATDILNFEPAGRYYVSRPKHPVGHSGSPLVVGEKVWAIASAHYLDGNVPRGCFISAGQLRAWLEQQSMLAGTIGGEQPPRASLAARLNTLRTRLKEAFALLNFQPGSQVKLTEGVPDTLHALLLRADQATGEDCLDALAQVVSQLAEEIVQGVVSAPAGNLGKFRAAFQVALMTAGQVCQNLECLNGLQGHQVPADTVEGATLAIRPEPAKSMVSGERWGLPALVDKHAIELAEELGEGEYAKNDIARRVYASMLPPGNTPASMTPELRNGLRGLARVEMKKGQQRMLVLKSQDADRLTPELRAWIKEMNLGLLELQGDDGRLFWFAEPELLATLNELLRTLNQPPWHTP